MAAAVSQAPRDLVAAFILVGACLLHLYSCVRGACPVQLLWPGGGLVKGWFTVALVSATRRPIETLHAVLAR
jgi:hypothetical protein